MKTRIRNKYVGYIECKHRVYNKEILSYNPYFEQIENYCSLNRQSKENNNGCNCYKCKNFTLSKLAMKKAIKLKAIIKRGERRKDKINSMYSENGCDIHFPF